MVATPFPRTCLLLGCLLALATVGVPDIAVAHEAIASVAAQQPLFARILERVRASATAGRHPIVVCDLDDTLLRTAFRTQAAMRAWTETPAGRPYAPALARLPLEAIGWDVGGTLAKLGVPEAERAGATRFWASRFFSNDYLRFDQPNPGAVAFVKAVLRAGGRVVYMSGRSGSMEPGTETSLKALGFPLDGDGKRAWLVMKTAPGGDDASFKEAASAGLPRLGEVVACLDNEPANVNAFHRSLPAAIAVLLVKPHSPNPPPLAPGTERALDFPLP